MTFNVSKCKYMIISRKPSPLQPLSILKINDTLLAQVHKFKYLGVWLSERLDWSIHVQAITKTAARTVGMLYRRFYEHASSNTLIKVAGTLINMHNIHNLWSPQKCASVNAVQTGLCVELRHLLNQLIGRRKTARNSSCCYPHGSQ